MAAIFGPAANLAAKVTLCALAAATGGGILFWWLWPRTDYARHVREVVDQPVPFSHQHHVGGLGIDCRFCHSAVEVSSNAGLPPTYTCMTCHSQIWTNAALLAPVRASLANDTPIVWHRVTDLPDYVYFNHSIHIAKGIGCTTCHGPVGDMPLMWKSKSLYMSWCIDCHRNPAPHLRPLDAVFDPQWHRTADTPSGAALMRTYHIHPATLTDCSVCHR